MKVKTKLYLSIFGLSAIIIFMFMATSYLTNKQKDDGLIINLAGRQRMLSQKMTKEFLLNEIEKDKTGQENPDIVDNIRNTSKIFDMTLNALRDSGQAPLSIDLKNSEYRFCPQSTLITQLKK